MEKPFLSWPCSSFQKSSPAEHFQIKWRQNILVGLSNKDGCSSESFYACFVQFWAKSDSWWLLKNLIKAYDKIESSADIHIALREYVYLWWLLAIVFKFFVYWVKVTHRPLLYYYHFLGITNPTLDWNRVSISTKSQWGLICPAGPGHIHHFDGAKGTRWKL